MFSKREIKVIIKHCTLLKISVVSPSAMFACYHSIHFSIVTVTTINYKLFSIRYNIENCSICLLYGGTFTMKMLQLQLRCYDN